MILEYELIKREGNQVGKRLVYRIVPNDINNSESIPYPNEVEKLCQDGYVVENTRVVNAPIKLKLYFAMFAVLKDHEYHASAGYIFAYDRERAIEMLKKRYGEETRVRSIEELPYEEGTVLYGERWHKL